MRYIRSFIVIICGLTFFIQSCIESKEEDKSIIDTQKELLIGKWAYDKTPSAYMIDFIQMLVVIGV